jgi:hypothetical protein
MVDTNQLDEIDEKLNYVKRLKDSTELWAFIASVYYIIQNVYFFFLEGWHTTALSDTEKIVDNIGSILFMAIGFMFARTVWRAIQLLISVIDLD